MELVLLLAAICNVILTPSAQRRPDLRAARSQVA